MTSPVKQVTTKRPPSQISRRQFRPLRFFGSAFLARTADEGARIALVLVALERTGSAAVGGTLVAALLIPHVVAAPVIGRLVDRSSRPGRILAAGVTLFAAGLAASVLLLGTAPLWSAFLVLAVAGCGGPAITGGLTSRLGDLVPDERQPRAFGLDSLFYNVASMAGPAGVALAATFADPTVATLGLACLAVLGAAGILTLRLDARPSADAPPAGLLGGGRVIIREPALRDLTVTTSLAQLGLGALSVVATVLAATLHRPAAGGLLLAAVAAGSLLGSLIWTWRPLRASWAPVVTGWSMIGIAIPLAAAALVGSDPDSLTMTAVLFGCSGFFVGPFAAALFLARNQLAPPAVRAQVFTIGAGLKVTASAAGAALIGFAAEQPASTQLLLVAAAPFVAGIVCVVLIRRAAC